MAMKKVKDVVFADKSRDKTKYVNVGALFERDDGSLSIKLDAVPVGFDGWLNCYDPKPRDGQQTTGRRGQQQEVADEDLPF